MTEPIAFVVSLTARDWEQTIGGWRCPALRIPGAQVEDVFHEGARVDRGWYEVLSHMQIIKWNRVPAPATVVASIVLSQPLATKALAAYWQKMSILMPLLTAVATFVLTTAFNSAKPVGSGGGEPSLVATPIPIAALPPTPTQTPFAVKSPVAVRRTQVPQAVPTEFLPSSEEKKIGEHESKTFLNDRVRISAGRCDEGAAVDLTVNAGGRVTLCRAAPHGPPCEFTLRGRSYSVSVTATGISDVAVVVALRE